MHFPLLEGLAPETVSCTTAIYFGGVRHEGPRHGATIKPLRAHWVLLNLQRNPADVTGFCYTELAPSNYPIAAKIARE